MQLKRIGPLSAGKVMGILYAAMGLLMGLLTTVMSLFTTSLMGDTLGDYPLVSLIFGVGSVIVMPIFYGVMGFVMGLVGAFLYNVVAGAVGGIELHIE